MLRWNNASRCCLFNAMCWIKASNASRKFRFEIDLISSWHYSNYTAYCFCVELTLPFRYVAFLSWLGATLKIHSVMLRSSTLPKLGGSTARTLTHRVAAFTLSTAPSPSDVCGCGNSSSVWPFSIWPATEVRLLSMFQYNYNFVIKEFQ